MLPPHLPGLEPDAFRSRVRRSTTEPSPIPSLVYQVRQGTPHTRLEIKYAKILKLRG